MRNTCVRTQREQQEARESIRAINTIATDKLAIKSASSRDTHDDAGFKSLNSVRNSPVFSCIDRNFNLCQPLSYLPYLRFSARQNNCRVRGKTGSARAVKNIRRACFRWIEKVLLPNRHGRCGRDAVNNRSASRGKKEHSSFEERSFTRTLCETKRRERKFFRGFCLSGAKRVPSFWTLYVHYLADIIISRNSWIVQGFAASRL